VPGVLVMHDVHMAEVSNEFQRCWQAAGLHIQNQAQGDLQSWLRAQTLNDFY
jgi:hypothetical protein